MRKLFLFSLLCAGVTALLACSLVAFALVGCLSVKVARLWMLHALLLALLLPPLGLLLTIPYLRRVRISRHHHLIRDAIRRFTFVAAGALVCAAITTGMVGPQLYHARYGERTTALITDTEPTYDEDDERIGTRYRVIEYATERDLGWLERGPAERAAKGERIEISVDPHGWIGPVAAQRLGYTTVPTAILVSCVAAVTLAALGIVAAALCAWPSGP